MGERITPFDNVGYVQVVVDKANTAGFAPSQTVGILIKLTGD